jgi:hypothetical protein
MPVTSYELNNSGWDKYVKPLFKPMDMGRVLSVSREDAERIARQTREWNTPGRSILHVREVRGREGSERPHGVYGAADAAAAGIFSALVTDAKINSLELLQEASAAIYGWRTATIPGRPMHPIVAALVGIERGEHWAFRLDCMVSDQTGDRQARAALYNFETDYPARELPAEYLTRASVMVQLVPFCLPIIAAVNGKAGH